MTGVKMGARARTAAVTSRVVGAQPTGRIYARVGWWNCCLSAKRAIEEASGTAIGAMHAPSVCLVAIGTHDSGTPVFGAQAVAPSTRVDWGPRANRGRISIPGPGANLACNTMGAGGPKH